MLIQIVSQLYYYLRFNFFNKSNNQMLLDKSYYSSIISFVILQFMSLDVDSDFIIFIVERFKQEIQTEKLWLQTLNNMPNGIILFNYMDDSIIFENQMVEDILKKSNLKVQSNLDLVSVADIE